MQIERVHFYVEDAHKWSNWFVQVMGFRAIASWQDGQTYTEVVSSGDQNSIKFVLASPIAASSPVAQYLRQHPPGVADVVLAVENLKSVMEKATALGANIIQPITPKQTTYDCGYWSQISNNVGFLHTLIERQDRDSNSESEFNLASSSLFTAIDHIVLNVAVGELEATANWYEQVFGFARQQVFTIQTQRSGLHSQVMIHPVSGMRLPINEPRSANSQVQEFLDLNHGAGIQHIALSTQKITQVTQQLRQAGLSFLSVPPTYYQAKLQNDCQLPLSEREWQAIVQQEILVDDSQMTDRSEHSQAKETNPLLLQIFSQPIFEQPTFFFEIIERRDQAQGFGEGNFRALFTAIEQEQAKRGFSS